MSDTLFRAKAPGIMNLLMADFGVDLESAAAILGNLGHESGGFRSLQEIRPTIAGSAGGFGWAQWTGSRRDQYEAYCSRNGYDPASDTANYKFLFVELSGSERGAIPAVKNAVGLQAKVQAFEMAFERAGIKGYESRMVWANKALEAYHANPGGRLEIADAPGTVPAVPTKIEVLDPIRTASQPLDPSQLIAVFVALLHQVMAIPQVRAVIEPLVVQMLGIVKPAPVEPPPPAPAKTDRPSVQLGFAGVIGSLIAMATGHLGTPLGMGEAPTVAGNVAPLVSALVGGVGLLGGGWAGLIGPALKIVGGLASAATAKK